MKRSSGQTGNFLLMSIFMLGVLGFLGLLTPPDSMAGPDLDQMCINCHTAYQGMWDNTPKLQMIFVEPIPSLPWFQFPPQAGNTSNVDADTYYYESQFCINCHTASQGTWDSAPKLLRNRVHHPTGLKWVDTSCSSCHGLDVPADILDYLDGWLIEDEVRLPVQDLVFSCTNCHTQHTEIGNTNFLRLATFEHDATDFCEHCHRPCGGSGHGRKTAESLSVKGGKHYKTQEEAASLGRPVTRVVWNISPDPGEEEVGCGGCMFCHVVHTMAGSNDKREASLPLRTDLRALMRIPARELQWEDEANLAHSSIDPIDRYEAMCTGCHDDPGIVGGHGHSGSLLDTTRYSHRFAHIPDPNRNPAANIASRGFPLSDGDGPDTLRTDDYGTVEGQVYCGTCHDIHDNQKPPYLFRTTEDDQASPHVADDPNTKDVVEGFCEQCHGLDPLGGLHSHPVGNPGATIPPMSCNPIPRIFSGGGSGSPNGLTSPDGGLLCLTCHNVRAAATSWDGRVKMSDGSNSSSTSHGNLLVMDNFSDEYGANLCVACHDQLGPSTEEVCDGRDNDCDGKIDEDFDVMTDPDNCGSCGYACPSYPHRIMSCLDGQCVTGDCEPGWYDLDGDPSNGCESHQMVFDMQVPAGWSMISLPVDPADKRIKTLFPEATAVFSFENSYIYHDPNGELPVGRGYWIYMPQDKVYSLTGTPLEAYEITDVPAGWSMIGACSFPSTISLSQGRMRAVFGFDNRYTLLDPVSDPGHTGHTLQPGQGYWINLSEPTNLRVEKP